MDIYEDRNQPIERRVNDLLSQMNVEEKAGMMFISGTRVNDDGSLDDIPGKGMFADAAGRQADNREEDQSFKYLGRPSHEIVGYLEQQRAAGRREHPARHSSNDCFRSTSLLQQ